ncbi:MAG: hypothetical protein GY835_04060 [bacterium]|nr:hypothetical protein [bacterium]
MVLLLHSGVAAFSSLAFVVRASAFAVGAEPAIKYALEEVHNLSARLPSVYGRKHSRPLLAASREAISRADCTIAFKKNNFPRCPVVATTATLGAPASSRPVGEA